MPEDGDVVDPVLLLGAAGVELLVEHPPGGLGGAARQWAEGRMIEVGPVGGDGELGLAEGLYFSTQWAIPFFWLGE